MSLMRQVAWLVLGVVLAALVGAVGLSTLSMRQLMQAQLQLKNADNAQALALALSQQGGDAELIKLLVSAQFDTGAYERVAWRGSDGRVLFERQEGARPSQAPAWFQALAPIVVADGKAQVSSGWNALGSVEVRSHSAYAYDTLWASARRLLAWLLVVSMVASAVAWGALRRIRRPLDAAVAQAEAVMGGTYTQVVEPRVPELQRLTRAMNGMVARVRQLFDAQAGQLLVLRAQVHQDALTGVSTRKHFMAELGSALERDEGPLHAGLMLLRLRELAGLNTRLGHAEVDGVIKTLADTLKSRAEQGAGCLVGRLNGSDFALWLPIDEQAESAAQALAEALRSQLPAFGEGVRVAMSLVVLPRERPLAVWMGEADAALARAEGQGQGTVELAVESAAVGAVQGEAAWRQQLVQALDRHRGRLQEFPVLDRQGQLLHWECPLQLRLDPEGDWLSASRWLPLAQRSQLTARIDLFAVSLALAASTRDQARRSINIAPASLLDPGFLPELRAMLADQAPAAACLSLELAELAATRHFDLLVELGRQLRSLGVQLGVEHAGSGLAQVEGLYQAGLQYVKLDASVVRGVAGDPARVAFVRGMVLLLHSLSIQACGEGVGEALDAQALWDCELDGLTGPWATQTLDGRLRT